MRALEHHPFAVAGADGATVRAVLHLASAANGTGASALDGTGASACPVIIICHGFKGFKDWGFFPWLSDRLAEAGCAALRMDFSHNGVGENPETFERLDLFERDTIGKCLTDLAAVIAAVRAGDFAGAERCDPDRLGLVGHSRGGGTVLLYAAEHEAVGALATIAPVSSFLRMAPSQLNQWRRDGHFDFPNARTQQDMRMGVGFLVEVDSDPERFSVERACQRLDRPLLVVHGVDDESVPLFEGEAVASWGGPKARLEALPGTGHTLGGVHPFAGPTPALERAAELIGAHFREHLGAVGA